MIGADIAIRASSSTAVGPGVMSFSSNCASSYVENDPGCPAFRVLEDPRPVVRDRLQLTPGRVPCRIERFPPGRACEVSAGEVHDPEPAEQAVLGVVDRYQLPQPCHEQILEID